MKHCRATSLESRNVCFSATAHLQEKGNLKVEMGVGEGGKFMCDNITVPILHTAMTDMIIIAIKKNNNNYNSGTCND